MIKISSISSFHFRTCKGPPRQCIWREVSIDSARAFRIHLFRQLQDNFFQDYSGSDHGILK